MGWLQDELKRWTRIAEATKVLPAPETELECEPLKLNIMKVQLIETHEPDGHWLKVMVNNKLRNCFKVKDNKEEKMQEAQKAFDEAVATASIPESQTILKSVEI